MNKSKTIGISGHLFFLLCAMGAGLHAAVILDVPNGALSASDPTQLGRLSRNSVQQDWAGSEPFPGVLNTTTPYNYETFTINVGVASYIQIDFDTLSPNIFVSAYDNAYVPNSAAANRGLDVNWLGDAGSSGDYFGYDAQFFNVFVPANDNLVVVVNTTAAAGLAAPFHLTVEGFVDSMYTDPPPTAATPEPSAVFLFGGGMALALAVRFRLRRG